MSFIININNLTCHKITTHSLLSFRNNLNNYGEDNKLSGVGDVSEKQFVNNENEKDELYAEPYMFEKAIDNIENITTPNTTCRTFLNKKISDEPEIEKTSKNVQPCKNNSEKDDDPLRDNLILSNLSVESSISVNNNDDTITKTNKIFNSTHVRKKQKSPRKRPERRKSDVDTRKAPDIDVEVQIELNKPGTIKTMTVDKEHHKATIEVTLCEKCNAKHMEDHCPLQVPRSTVSDAVMYADWKRKTGVKLECNENETVLCEGSFSYDSLPPILVFDDTDTPHGTGVFSKADIAEFTQFGPLIGSCVKEVDISEDSNMRYLWEVHSTDGCHIYVNTEDHNSSNWIRFVRPAPTRAVRNLTAVSRSNELYLISSRVIKMGEELLYWQDDTINHNKKKMEKTSTYFEFVVLYLLLCLLKFRKAYGSLLISFFHLACGGCNMNFNHPLYYRIHCSVFHDIRYSLTIRKYHCKVCGAAILGKENIMKHAAELHNGQGAYQCQFCKKVSSY